jgi:AraC-like DNA-binding protein
MEPSLNLQAILTILGAAQAVLFAGALLGTKRGNLHANRILAALLLAISVLLAWGVLSHTRYMLRVPQMAQLHVPFQFLIGPLVFFYVRAMLEKRNGLGRRDLWHFASSLICLLYLTPFYFQSSEYKLNYLLAAYRSYPTEWHVRTILLMAQALFYLIIIIVTLPMLRAQKKDARGAKIDPSDLFWARAWMGFFIIIWLAGVFRYAFDYSVQTNLIVPLFFSAFIYMAVYQRLRRPEVPGSIEGGVEPAIAAAPAEMTAIKKYEKSTLTKDRADRYVRRLVETMEKEKLYLDSDLTLQKLAQRLSIHPHHLSQIINERLNQNFFDFINSYRVEEAKKRLIDPSEKHFSIIAIAVEVGFNSKSAFNAVFKKYVNMTPSEWRKTYSNGH